LGTDFKPKKNVTKNICAVDKRFEKRLIIQNEKLELNIPYIYFISFKVIPIIILFLIIAIMKKINNKIV
jgi:hypothetical protein